jgi:ATP-dependent protease ClpP protease subunit
VDMKRLIALMLCLGLNWSACAKQQDIIELDGRNTVLLDKEITNVNIDTFAAALAGKRLLLPLNETLYVLIVSQGGNYEASLKVKVLFANMPNVAVICKYCASAAGMLFATHKGPRYATEKSEMMMHEMYMQHATAREVQDANAMKQFIANSDDFNRLHYSIIGMSKEEYEKKITDKEWSVYGQDLVKLHLADKFVIVHCNDYLKSIAPDTCSPKDQ